MSCATNQNRGPLCGIKNGEWNNSKIMTQNKGKGLKHWRSKGQRWVASKFRRGFAIPPVDSLQQRCRKSSTWTHHLDRKRNKERKAQTTIVLTILILLACYAKQHFEGLPSTAVEMMQFKRKSVSALLVFQKPSFLTSATSPSPLPYNNDRADNHNNNNNNKTSGTAFFFFN